MIVRRLEDLAGTKREVHAPTFISRRLLLKSDGLGFSLHDTVLHAGTQTEIHYQNHLEAVYCIEGKGSVRDKQTGEIHAISPGTVYALNDHDAHVLTAETDLRMVCVFNPALIGPEVHDENGVYPVPSES